MKFGRWLKLYSLIIPLILAYFLYLEGYGQDLITLKNGDIIESKIISIHKRIISFYKWEDKEKKIFELSQKQIKWFRPELWTKKRVSFLFSFGAIPVGTSTDLKNFMKNNNYDDPKSPLSPLLPPLIIIFYPNSNVKIPWITEIEYLFKPPNGMSFSFSRINNGSVAGYNESLKVSPEVFYKNSQFSVSYKHYSKSYRSSLQAGILLNFNKISWKIDSWSGRPGGSKTDPLRIKPGFLIGYLGSLLEKNTFFLRFQTQFMYVLPLKFLSDDNLLGDERISLSSLFVGIQTGLKTYSRKK